MREVKTAGEKKEAKSKAKPKIKQEERKLNRETDMT